MHSKNTFSKISIQRGILIFGTPGIIYYRLFEFFNPNLEIRIKEIILRHIIKKKWTLKLL